MSDSPSNEEDTQVGAPEEAAEVPEQVPGGTQGSETADAAEESLEEAADTGEGEDPEPAADQSGRTADGDPVSEGEGDVDDEEDDDNPLETEGEVAADYLEELLDIADLDGDIDTYVEGDRAHVSIVTEGDQLVGPKGEVLDALQELARLAVMTETGHRSRLMLDVAGYRDRRRKTLVELAGDAVTEVKTSGEAVRLSPMNPFERKIVHDAVAEAGLVSESEGQEPSRRVVVLASSK